MLSFLSLSSVQAFLRFRSTLVVFAFAAIVGPVSLASAQSELQLRDLNRVTHFEPPKTMEGWEKRSQELRMQLAVSLGLYPAPELEAVRPSIYGKMEFEGYSIEKVTFESLPGYFVTGNLYRPAMTNADSGEKLPAVLCPHGHWMDARFYEASEADIKQALATGAERFETAARNHIQARCVQLARMGCIVFHWDMMGYCDSQQISYSRAHRYGVGENLNPEEDEWLLFSAEAEARLQSVAGLQTLATSRAVDMLLALPEVDPARIAITGASGGGTQSFIGAALDERINVAFPAVMVSTGMQGGCTCENACWLRNGTVNVELAGLVAPRPMGLTAADDWTRTMPEDGFSELKQLYGLFNKVENVSLFPALHFGHNFNHVSRVAMYGWINDHFDLGYKKPILERDFELAKKERLTVWDAQHPPPRSGIEFEKELLELWSQISSGQLRALMQGDKGQRDSLREILRDGWRVCLGTTSQSKPTQVDLDAFQKQLAGLRNGQGIQFHNAVLGEWSLTSNRPKNTNNKVVVKTSNDSKTSHAFDVQAIRPRSESDLQIVLLNARGETESTWYPLLQGRVSTEKLNKTGESVVLDVVQQRLVNNPRPAAAYTYGYNMPLFVRRAQQLAATLTAIRTQDPNQRMAISGHDSDAALALAAVVIVQEQYSDVDLSKGLKLYLEFKDFSFESVDDIRHPEFLPGSTKYLGVGGMLALLQSDVMIEASEEWTIQNDSKLKFSGVEYEVVGE